MPLAPCATRPLRAAAPRRAARIRSATPTAPPTDPATHPPASGGGCPLGFGGAPPSTADAAAASAADPAAPRPLPPGSFGLPLGVGETVAMFADIPGFYAKRRAAAGGAPVIKTHIFGAPAAVVFDKHAVRRLLQSDGTLVETDWPASTRQLLGEQSMLNQRGARHAAQRRVLGQAFTQAAVQSYGAVVETAVRRSLAAWAGAGYLQAAPAAKDLAFDVAARALVAPTMSDETAAAFRRDFDVLVLGMMTLPIALPFSKYRASLRARDRLVARIDALISDEIGAPPTPPGVARNALQLMLAAVDDDGSGRASRVELQDQVLTQLLAGHETTATSLIKMLTLLHDHPDVLAALRAEQDAVVAAHGDALTPAAVAAMPLADATVRETMRVAPIVQSVFRRALVDLDVCGARVPAGWRVVLMIGPTAADIDAWKDDAAAFRPARWLENAGAASPTLMRDPVGFNPFGLGPHICLGAGLALAELRAIVAVLARDYEWALADPDEPWTPPLPPTRGRPIWFWKRGGEPPAGMGEKGEAVADVPAFLF